MTPCSPSSWDQCRNSITVPHCVHVGVGVGPKKGQIGDPPHVHPSGTTVPPHPRGGCHQMMVPPSSEGTDTTQQ